MVTPTVQCVVSTSPPTDKSLKARIIHLFLDQGTDAIIPLLFVDGTGHPYNLTGCAILYTLKRNAADAVPLVSRPGAIDTPATGIAHVPIWGQDIADLVGDFVNDIQLTKADNTRDETMLLSTVTIRPTAGRAGQLVTVLPTQPLLAQFGNWLGTYNPAHAYAIGDLVQYVQGGATSSYRCIAVTTGNAPTNATYWQLIAGLGPYVAAHAPDWNNAPPATYAEALDRLAAKLTPVP